MWLMGCVWNCACAYLKFSSTRLPTILCQGRVLYTSTLDFHLHKPNNGEFMGQMSLGRYNYLFWVCLSTPPVQQIKHIHTLKVFIHICTHPHVYANSNTLTHTPRCVSQTHMPELKWSKECSNDQRSFFLILTLGLCRTTHEYHTCLTWHLLESHWSSRERNNRSINNSFVAGNSYWVTFPGKASSSLFWWLCLGSASPSTPHILNMAGPPSSTYLSGAGQISLLSVSASWVQMALPGLRYIQLWKGGLYNTVSI